MSGPTATVVSGPTPPTTPIAWIDGEWQRIDAYGLTVTTQGLQYGTGVFEGIRAYRDGDGEHLHVVRLTDHVTRFFQGCRLLRMDPGCTEAEFADIVVELLVRNGCTSDTYIRPIATKSRLEPGAPFGVQLASVANLVAIYCLPMPSNHGARTARCSVSSWRRVPDESIPARGKITGGYANIALAVDEAQAAGYDDAILLNIRGTVAEASTANVFVVRDDALVTPGPDADILEGVTRSCVLELATARGLGVTTRHVGRSELYLADEVFLTGTGCELIPVVEVDGRRVGSGKTGRLTELLLNDYHAAVRGQDPRYRGWLTSTGMPATADTRKDV